MPVIAIIAATICHKECKEKNVYIDASIFPEQAFEKPMGVATCFLKPNYLLYITVYM